MVTGKVWFWVRKEPKSRGLEQFIEGYRLKNTRARACCSSRTSSASDSMGTIAGNLLGAMLGAPAISAEWLRPLELVDVITEIADDLFDPDWHVSEYNPNEIQPQRRNRAHLLEVSGLLTSRRG